MIEKTLGHYRVGEQLGRGGMGEVYLADDLNLNRKVALKFLPDAFAGDPERMARFEREAKLLASLNHANIAAIYGLEQAEGKRFLVLELVEGETLAQMISKGPLPVDEALAVCRQIAEGLEAAHEKGVIHRDLKPANVMITEGDKVKILDFGLAKALSDEMQTADSSQSPTLTEAMTRPGVILGTAAYMSPEQAKGKAVDKRADIWAFGCILYECLTGKRAFEGETVTETLAAVLTQEPKWDKAPAREQPLLRRCLERDPKRRLRDIGDAILLLEGMPEQIPLTHRRPWLSWSASALFFLVAVALAFMHFRGQPEPESMLFQIPVSRMPGDSGIAISPDGRSIAFVASLSGSIPSLFIRPIGSATPRQLEGTAGASYPFWSPDNRSIGFFAGGRLKIADIASGLPRDLCVGVGTWGATWNKDGVILFSAFPVLRQVSATGGEPVDVTKLDETKREIAHLYPFFLPDGRHYIFTVTGLTMSKNSICVGSLDSQEKIPLISGSIPRAVYAEPGYILFLRDDALFAQPFDIKALKVTGEATRLADNMPFDTQGRASYSASQNGILLYRSIAGQGKSQFIWFDRTGKPIGPAGAPARFTTNFDLSSDGKRIAATENDDLRVIEWERNVTTRLTFDSAYNGNMAWSPDGLQIAFTTTRKGNWDIFVKKLSENEEAKPLLESAGAKWVKDWSKDGRYISYVFGIQEPDLYALPLFGDKKPFPIVQSPFSQDMPRFSYDGKGLAYDSNESGTWQVYIDAFPEGRQKRQISTTGAGGAQPHWRQDGRELYYLALDGTMMAVDISGDSKLEPGIARPLFDTELNVDPVNDQYSVTPDGGRFLILKPLSEAASTPITVVLNWTSLLKK